MQAPGRPGWLSPKQSCARVRRLRPAPSTHLRCALVDGDTVSSSQQSRLLEDLEPDPKELRLVGCIQPQVCTPPIVALFLNVPEAQGSTSECSWMQPMHLRVECIAPLVSHLIAKLETKRRGRTDCAQLMTCSVLHQQPYYIQQPQGLTLDLTYAGFVPSAEMSATFTQLVPAFQIGAC